MKAPSKWLRNNAGDAVTPSICRNVLIIEAASSRIYVINNLPGCVCHLENGREEKFM